MGDYDTAGEEDEYEYYLVNDGRGISRVLRRPRGRLPQVRCVGCDD